MGEGLITCLDEDKTTGQHRLHQRRADRQQRRAVQEGYEEALKPKIDSGDYKLVGDQTGEWDATKAGTAFEQMYTDNDGKVDGVVSANDTMAGGVIARLKAQRLGRQGPGHRPGRQRRGPAEHPARRPVHDRLQEHQPRGRRRLRAGDRADQGRHEAAALATGSVTDPDTGEDVPSALATPVRVYNGQRQGGLRRRLPDRRRRLHR